MTTMDDIKLDPSVARRRCYVNGPYIDEEGLKDTIGTLMAHTLCDEDRLMRFLILGCEGGTYYATQFELRLAQVECVTRLIQNGQGEFVVEKISEVARNGRAIRMNSVLQSLALCCRSDDMKTKSAAYRAIPEVCNIPTHLFKLISFMESGGKTTGWGRGLRKAVSAWYNQFSQNPRRLAMLVTKYREREGWCHRDIMRLAHLVPCNDVVGFILRYVIKGLDEAKQYYLEDESLGSEGAMLRQIVSYLDAVEEMRHLVLPKLKTVPDKANCQETQMDMAPAAESDAAMMEEVAVSTEEQVSVEIETERVLERAVTLIRQFDLVREHLPTSLLNTLVVWEALLEKMPMMAMVRNLNKMTSLGAFGVPENVATVVNRLNNREALVGSKIHPYSILVALQTYTSGRGIGGQQTWIPVPEISKALENAFYAAFDCVTPTNKRILLAIDVSTSMTWLAKGMVITPRIGSTAMMMVTHAVEKEVDVVTFSGSGLTPMKLMNIRKEWTLQQTLEYVDKMPAFTTNITAPMLWALKQKKTYDAFIIYTDSEMMGGPVPPMEAIKQYRQMSGIHDARLAVVAMSGGAFTVADPNDRYSMDVMGFDPSTPTALEEFLTGSIYQYD